VQGICVCGVVVCEVWCAVCVRCCVCAGGVQDKCGVACRVCEVWCVYSVCVYAVSACM
jgi:hypothetical protein